MNTIKKDEYHVVHFLMMDKNLKERSVGLCCGWEVVIARSGHAELLDTEVFEVDGDLFPGLYNIVLTPDETDREGELFIQITHPSCYPQVMTYAVVNDNLTVEIERLIMKQNEVS